MKFLKFIILCILLAGMFVSSAWPATITFSENFNNGLLDPRLTLSTSPGFNITFSGGKIIIDKASGITSGTASIYTTFDVIGDFSATVKVDRTNINGNFSAGLVTWHEPTGFTDVYFIGPRIIRANIFVPSDPGFGYRTAYDPNSLATFRIRRIGDTIFEEFNTGYGFQTLHSATDSCLAGPVKIGIFGIEEEHVINARSVTFDDFEITGDQFIFPPTSCCKGDFNRDGDVDGSDLAIFASDFGRTDCLVKD